MSENDYTSETSSQDGTEGTEEPSNYQIRNYKSILKPKELKEPQIKLTLAKKSIPKPNFYQNQNSFDESLRNPDKLNTF